MRAPRSDPPTAPRRVEQPAVLAQGLTRTRVECRPLHVLDVADGAVEHELTEAGASGVMAELEVEQRDGACFPRRGLHRGRVGGSAAERLVAQDRFARREGAEHELAMAERR